MSEVSSGPQTQEQLTQEQLTQVQSEVQKLEGKITSLCKQIEGLDLHALQTLTSNLEKIDEELERQSDLANRISSKLKAIADLSDPATQHATSLKKTLQLIQEALQQARTLEKQVRPSVKEQLGRNPLWAWVLTVVVCFTALFSVYKLASYQPTNADRFPYHEMLLLLFVAVVAMAFAYVLVKLNQTD